MQHFPIFMTVAGRRIVVSGGGAAALAKLRLLMKTEAQLTVFAADPAKEIETWASEGKLRLVRRAMQPGDAMCAVLFYAADEDDAEDARTAAIARADGALVNYADDSPTSNLPSIVPRGSVPDYRSCAVSDRCRP